MTTSGAPNGGSEKIDAAKERLRGRRPPSASMWNVRRRVPGFLRRLGAVGISLVVAPILVAVLWLRFFGLPDGAKQVLLRELQTRGLKVNFDRLLLDPTGGLLADNLTVYDSSEGKNALVQVNRARLGFAWFSWWTGRPFLESASVRQAEIRLPVGPQETIDLRDVNAAVDWDPDGLRVLSAEARLFDFRFLLSGRIHLAGMASARRPATPEDIARREALWRQIREEFARLKTENPIEVQAQFDVALADWQGGTVLAGLHARDLTWRGVRVEEVTIAARLREGVAFLEDFRVRLARGEFSAEAEWPVGEKSAEARFNSNLDFTPVSRVVEGAAREALQKLAFAQSLPEMSGRCKVNWDGPVRYDLHLDLDWRDFTYANARFDRLRIAAAADGTRLLIADGILATPRGTAKFEAYEDQSAQVAKARIHSDIDPTFFIGVLGEGADRFLKSCRIPGRGPKIEASVTGKSFRPGDMAVSGTLDAGAFSYKGVAFVSARGNLEFADSVLTVKNLIAKRPEGEATGGIVYHFARRTVRLDDFYSTLDVQEVAPVLGGKFPDYVAPYRFSKPPRLKLQGWVDLRSDKAQLQTDLTVDVDADGAMRWKLFGVDFVFGQPEGTLRFINRDLTVTMKRSRLFGGMFSGKLSMDLSTQNPNYETSLKMDDVDFKQLMTTVFKHDDASGRMDGEASFSGRLGLLETINGKGQMSIRDGYLLSIPFLGGLSSLLGAIIPDWGYARASDADCHFTLAKGYVATQNLDIHSTNFTLIGEGRFNFVKDDLDMRVRANVRGLAGVFLFPVSKLFEYRGTGSLKNVKWEPENF
jgi:hypothetical protein